MSSKLFVCGNHLGNIEDIPSRTIKALINSDLVFCEDTRTIGRMLSELNIKDKVLVSYYDHNERSRVESLKKRLEHEELTIALISEAGMPMISDPGYHIVNLFHELSLDIEVIPGPTACVSALVLSGFSLEEFSFVGFWPRKKGQQSKIIEEVLERKTLLVFYESPKRITKTLENILVLSENIEVFVVKELTKKYEQYWRGSIQEIVTELSKKEQKGEFTVVLKAKAVR